jgi:hypothetical protein
MQSSAETLMAKMEYLYKNIFNLLTAFQEASTTTTSSITVTLYDDDGNSYTKTVTSFQALQKELTRIDANYKSLISADNLSYTLNSDGSISQQTKTSFMNAEYLSSFTADSASIIIDKTSTMKDLIYPNVKLPITLDSTIYSNVYCKIFEVSDGWSSITDGLSLLAMQYLIDEGTVTAEEVNRILTLEKTQVKYFGKFTTTVCTVDSTSSNVFYLTLSSIKYSSLYTTTTSIDLKVDDILVSKTGSSKYQITAIDKTTNSVTVTRIAGSEVLAVGTNNLYFNETLTTEETFIVGVPIRPSQTIVIFLSTENFKNRSFPSTGLKIDTSSYEVTYNSETYTLDEFFSEYVTNFSAYLSAYMDETSIPASLGLTPTTPTLLSSNFKVIQINKHLSDSSSVTAINTLNANKQKIQNDIDYKQTTIDNLQNQINTQTFSSTEEKKSILSEITTLKSEINTLKSNLLTVATQIDDDATTYGLKNVTPKYKVIGFWPVQTPMTSTETAKQHIIKYDVLYRYLSISEDTVDNTSYTMTDDDGNSVTVAFSSWQPFETLALSKVKDDDGNWNWETQSVDSVDEVNINQCSISINEGESVEIKIRAISEAGYPLAPVKSEWSNVVRIDFPDSLSQSSIVATISKNNIDLNNAEFDNILNTYGLLNHIAGQVTESEKTFLHVAKDIASGQYTSEQKNIALDSCITSILARITALESSSATNTVTVSVIDFNEETYSVTNNTTMELFAGNYADTAAILDSDKWGTIIRKKGYIKIYNPNSVAVELKSLVPGTTFSATTAPTYYNVPVQNVDDLIQTSKQIFYCRNVDLTGQSSDSFKLVSAKLADSSTIPSDIDTTAADTDKNIVYYDSTNDEVKICALKSTYDTTFVAYTTDHPSYDVDDLSAMKTEFTRLAMYTANVKAIQYQTAQSSGDGLVGFNDNEFYAVGQYTCGAFLYPIIASQSAICVVGDTTTATLIISKETSILIPFVFEFRMIDRLGNINGLLDQDSNTTLEYSKKMGIDILLPDATTFKFDINCTCRLKSKITTADTSTVSSVVASYTGETTASTT